MVIASAAPVADAVPATSATPENSADEQSGGVSPTDRLCTFLTPCESWPVPPLLNLDQGSYVPTPEQKESLRALEAQAVANVIKGHGLTDADTDAVKTWGRYDALAALYTLIVEAINETDRTTDQQNVADWVANAGQQLSIGAAQAAGREYVKWAGLDRSTFESLLKSDTSEADLKTFLKGVPLNYNNPNTTLATGGWCVYRSPDPYSTDYTAWKTDPLCLGVPCTSFLGCKPPTPTYDNFVKWGQGAASASILNSAQFQRTGAQLAKAIGVAVAAAAAIPLASVAPALLVGIPTAVQIASWAEEGVDIVVTSLTPFAEAASGVVAAAAVVAIVVFAIVTAVVEGMHVISAAELPGQLAELITDSYTTTVDPTTLLTTSDGGTSLYTIFIGDILPEPLPTICDNSGGLPPGVTFSGDFYELPKFPPCMNAPAIPEASALDAQFLVKRDGGTTETAASTITFKDSGGVATTVRLSKNWFVGQANGITTQTLRIEYPDWDGKDQNAWLLGNPKDGYAFVTYSAPNSSQTLDTDTCVSQGLCSAGASIEYVGADGRHYSARVRAVSPAVGSPKFSGPASSANGIEGSPMSFDANGFTLTDAVGTVKHTWRFQHEACRNGLEPCWGFNTETMQQTPSYSDPVTGDTATHTWGLAGSYLVELTATDSRLVTVSTVFAVTVENVPPTLEVLRECQSSLPAGGGLTPCSVQTIDPGETADIAGWFSDTGDKSDLRVTINWGDGARDSQCISPNGTCVNFASPLQLSKPSGQQKYAFAATHNYAAAGTYYGTVWVNDPIGGSDSESFVVKVTRLKQAITMTGLSQQSYGNAPMAISATGGASGQPVTFAVTGSSTVCALSGSNSSGASTSATVSLLAAGKCLITAQQAGNDTYDAARGITLSFDVNPATVTVTASSGTMTFGASMPAITPGVHRLRERRWSIRADHSSGVLGRRREWSERGHASDPLLGCRRSTVRVRIHGRNVDDREGVNFGRAHFDCRRRSEGTAVDVHGGGCGHGAGKRPSRRHRDVQGRFHNSQRLCGAAAKRDQRRHMHDLYARRRLTQRLGVLQRRRQFHWQHSELADRQNRRQGGNDNDAQRSGHPTGQGSVGDGDGRRRRHSSRRGNADRNGHVLRRSDAPRHRQPHGCIRSAAGHVHDEHPRGGPPHDHCDLRR